jgi:hypothetical protein
MVCAQTKAAAAEAWRAQLQANFDHHSRMRGDAP